MYKKSLPRKIFCSNVDMIASNVKELNTIECTTKIKDMVFSASIIECSASLECYIEQISSGWIHELEKNNIKNNSLPNELRHFVFGSLHKNYYAEYLLYHDESKFIKSLKKPRSLIFDDSEKVASRQIISCVVADAKYPSPANLKKIFGRFGIENLFDRLSSKLKGNAEFLLQSLMDIRCAVAHSYPTGKQFTFSDINKHISDMKKFVEALDRVLHVHFTLHAASECWPKK